MISIEFETETWCPAPFNLQDEDDFSWRRIPAYCDRMIDRTIGHSLSVFNDSAFTNEREIRENLERLLSPYRTSLVRQGVDAFSPVHYRPSDVVYMEALLEESINLQCSSLNMDKPKIRRNYAYDEERGQYSAMVSVSMSLLDAQRYMSSNYPEHVSVIERRIEEFVSECRRNGMPEAEIRTRLSSEGTSITLKMDSLKTSGVEEDDDVNMKMKYSLYFGNEPVFDKNAEMKYDGKSKAEDGYGIFGGHCGGQVFNADVMRSILKKCDKRVSCIGFKKLCAEGLVRFYQSPCGKAVAASAIASATMFLGPTLSMAAMTGGLCIAGVYLKRLGERMIENLSNILGRSMRNVCRHLENVFSGRIITLRDAFYGFGAAIINKNNFKDGLEIAEFASDTVGDISSAYEHASFLYSLKNVFSGKGDERRSKLAEYAMQVRDNLNMGNSSLRYDM